ncbi:MAG: SMI1/KNR4 family protein [Clostridiales bacterium]|nr:SMI1/KNR4 family protein [Clostridiales bacterium]
MISDELKTLIERIEKQGKMGFLEGATEEQISQFEASRGIKLPTKYKEWLLYSDGGEFFLPCGVQMYGVSHKPMIDIRDDDRPDDNYIVIGVLASGDPVLCEKRGERISIFNHVESKIEDDEVYEDFYSFVKDLYDMLGMGE